MKTCTQMMLSVVMDGIKDTDMMIDYAEDVASHGSDEYYRWFKAKARAEQTRTDYEYVKAQIGLEDRVNSGDDIAIALHSYLAEAVMDLTEKVNRI